MKFRIIETEGAQFFPQFKDGWLSPWYFYKKAADDMGWGLLVHMRTDDPAAAAAFNTHVEATAFMDRIDANASAGLDAYYAALARRSAGVATKRVLPR